MKSDAFIVGDYRYTLSRDWSDEAGLAMAEAAANGSVCFIMLNPSTADASKDDPTLRKCIGFAKRMGYSKLDVVNLFAYRATDPWWLQSKQKDGVDIIGPENDRFIFNAAMVADLVICAWGAYNGVNIPEREAAVLERVRKPLHCLGLTAKHNRPRHPLMLAYETKLEPWGTT